MEDITVFGINIRVLIIILFVLIIILSVLLLLTYRSLMKLSRKYYTLVSGETGSLEEVLTRRFSEVDKLKKHAKKLSRDHKEILIRADSCISKTGLVKYNALSDISGELSFSLALLDKGNSGIVLSSMHTRDSCYTYCKEIINGESAVPLSKEEQQAIENARSVDEEISVLMASDADLEQPTGKAPAKKDTKKSGKKKIKENSNA